MWRTLPNFCCGINLPSFAFPWSLMCWVFCLSGLPVPIGMRHGPRLWEEAHVFHQMEISWSQGSCIVVIKMCYWTYVVSAFLKHIVASGCGLLLPRSDPRQGFGTVVPCQCCVLFSCCRRASAWKQEGLLELLPCIPCDQVGLLSYFSSRTFSSPFWILLL